MPKCKVCGNELTCLKCQGRECGKKSVKKRFAGLSKKEISKIMKEVRKAGK